MIPIKLDVVVDNIYPLSEANDKMLQKVEDDILCFLMKLDITILIRVFCRQKQHFELIYQVHS